MRRIASLKYVQPNAVLRKPRNPPERQGPPRKVIDTGKFPVADYYAAKPSDPKERAKREARNKKYDDRYAPRITEFTERISSFSEWDRNLPPLPVDSSVAILVGEVVKSSAHLSEDQSAIYSEFDVRIQNVLKNTTSRVLTSGGMVSVERSGGRVRFPSGKIVESTVANQDMPQVGGRYVFFLIQETPLGAKTDDYTILTGYELAGGKVYPLDAIPSQLATYGGQDETSFINNLRSRLTTTAVNKTL